MEKGSNPAETASENNLQVSDKKAGVVYLVDGTAYVYRAYHAIRGLTNSKGKIGTKANLVEPGKRMLSSMTPTILARDGKPVLLIGSPGSKTIINTVLQVILNVVDHEMNIARAIEAPRIHHQWLPDTIFYEKLAFSPDTIAILQGRGHDVKEIDGLGVAEVIVVREDHLEGGVDRRQADGGAVGY